MKAAAVVSPTIRDERLAAVCARRTSYLYATLRTGITGKVTQIDEQSLSFLNRLKKSGKKILAGFGVASPEQVKLIAPHVHAVVVGTALIRCIEESRGGNLYNRLKEKVKELAG